MKLRGVLGLWVVVSACGPGPVTADAGLVEDAGGLVADAGPTCTGIPSNQPFVACVALDFYETTACKPSAAETLSAYDGGCATDAGTGTTLTWTCGELVGVQYQYGPFGDAYRCFYPPDGGALVGAINFSDRGALVAGRIAECIETANVCTLP